MLEAIISDQALTQFGLLKKTMRLRPLPGKLGRVCLKVPIVGSMQKNLVTRTGVKLIVWGHLTLPLATSLSLTRTIDSGLVGARVQTVQ